MCLHVCLHVNVQGKDESYVYHQAMYYWCVCACMCACTVKMRAMSPKCMAKPCATGLFVYMYLYRVKIRTMPRMCITKPCTIGYSVHMLVQNEDESYVPDVYRGAMYYGSLCVCVCTE